MAKLYGPLYAAIWREALCLPGRSDLFESLAAELATYCSISELEAQRRLVDTWGWRKDILREGFPRAPSREALQTYYSQQDTGILHGLYWHSLRPDFYPLHSVSGLHLVQQFAEGRRVFEFGHGVGSTGILFARNGFEVTMGDISESYRRFAQFRFNQRNLNGGFVDLRKDKLEPNFYDAVVSFDVVEHIPDPLLDIQKLWECLKPGGLMVLNVAFGRDPANPEHVLHRRTGFVDHIRNIGFERIRAPSLLVFYKREMGGLRRRLYRIQDLPDAVVSDVIGRWPRLGKLLRPYSAP